MWGYLEEFEKVLSESPLRKKKNWRDKILDGQITLRNTICVCLKCIHKCILPNG